MDIQTFEDFVRANWRTPEDVTLAVAALGLSGEAGEVADNVKKLLGHPWDGTERKDKLLLEMGDVLFYWVKLAHLFGFTPEEIMQANVDKLNKRWNNKT
jgi:NTP pyrophosphatase (non-canonical NTP hydrolase)